MKICDYNHDEIVHDSNKCPVCELQVKLQSAEDARDKYYEERDAAEDRVTDLEYEVEGLQKEIKKLEEKLESEQA